MVRNTSLECREDPKQRHEVGPLRTTLERHTVTTQVPSIRQSPIETTKLHCQSRGRSNAARLHRRCPPQDARQARDLGTTACTERCSCCHTDTRRRCAPRHDIPSPPISPTDIITRSANPYHHRRGPYLEQRQTCPCTCAVLGHIVTAATFVRMGGWKSHPTSTTGNELRCRPSKPNEKWRVRFLFFVENYSRRYVASLNMGTFDSTHPIPESDLT